MNKKELAGWGILSLAAPMLFVSTSLAAATIASGAESDVDSSSVSVSSTVTTEELCVWRVLNVPASVVLSSGGLEYEGTALDLVSTKSGTGSGLNVYSSGNTNAGDSLETGQQDCTFYGVKTRPILRMTVADGDFTATTTVDSSQTEDTALSFSASVAGSNGLDFDFEVRDGTTCDAKWSFADLSLDGSTLTGTALSISALADVTSPVNAGQVDRCALDYTISITVPAELTPTYPGNDYTWEGPSLTYALRADNS